MKDGWTLSEFANFCNRSHNTIRYHIRRGTVKPRKVLDPDYHIQRYEFRPENLLEFQNYLRGREQR